MSFKKGDVILLLSKDSSYLVNVRKEKLQTKDGVIDLSELFKKKYGDEIKTHLGKEFSISRVTLNDLLEKIVKRTAQVVLPKDSSLILAYTGIPNDSLVVDCGSGSGYLAIFLGWYLSKGKVVSYEVRKDFWEIAKENIHNSGLKNVKLKMKDVRKGIDEKYVDLITIDMKNPEKVIPHAYKSLKAGGFLVVYSPTVEEVIRVNKEIRKKSFCCVKTVENIVREWQVERTTRPKTLGLLHTGWLTFARKVV
jgi:tRNA (adenine57-N1/adenine58-N1)-methyltransferase